MLKVAGGGMCDCGELWGARRPRSRASFDKYAEGRDQTGFNGYLAGSAGKTGKGGWSREASPGLLVGC